MDEFVPTKPTKDFFERFAELLKDDKELHDAFVRAVNAVAERIEIKNTERRERLKRYMAKKGI